MISHLTTSQIMAAIILGCCVFLPFTAQAEEIPKLKRTGHATQLIVDGAPFLMLGGELGNSSSSNLDYLAKLWPTFTEMHLNTLLVPVYWDMIEPQEGQFNFALIDGMLKQARTHKMKVVVLWFGSWKNSMSSYAPSWVKRDQTRFPRAVSQEGKSQEILTPFHPNNFAADRAAYSALMQHLKKTDSKDRTVIMMQVENEIGMLPSARDYHPAATKVFNQAVPKDLIDYLESYKTQLVPEMYQAWQKNGFRTTGTWSETFGAGVATDEMFIAWYFARYTDEIAAAGKAIYPLPTYINAALNRPNVLPGDYPSGGPLPHLMDIWKAGAPTIDILTPDFYNPDFKHWNDLFVRQGDPLFIPEIRFEPSVGAKAFFTFGHYKALGFSPFSIETTENPKDENIAKSYAVLQQISPLILQHHTDSSIDGMLLDKTNTEQIIKLGGYEFRVKHDYTLGWSPKAKDDIWPESGGLIIQTGKDEFLVAGTGLVITFAVADSDKIAGIDSIYEGEFVKGKWQAGRNLNGDQSHQGRHLRIPVDEWGIQKLKLYQYQ